MWLLIFKVKIRKSLDRDCGCDADTNYTGDLVEYNCCIYNVQKCTNLEKIILM